MKIFVFFALVMALWYGMRWLQQITMPRPRQRPPGRMGAARPRAAAARGIDLISCPRCGSYVPSEFPAACGRRDCPYPGVG